MHKRSFPFDTYLKNASKKSFFESWIRHIKITKCLEDEAQSPTKDWTVVGDIMLVAKEILDKEKF